MLKPRLPLYHSSQFPIRPLRAAATGTASTPAIRDFLNKVPEPSLKGINVAAFDTRISTKLVGVFGYAAGRIVGNLKGKGGNLVASPEGFFVKGTEGPLREGELERAAGWARGIVESKK